MGNDLIREIEQFLYREARLLDERRFEDWLELFTDDVRYSMSGRANRYPRSSKAIAILDPARHRDEDTAKAGELTLLDETKESLKGRVARLSTGMAWAEDPPSRTRHLITNIEIEDGGAPGGIRAYSNFLVYRSRGEREEDFYVGARQDVLRQAAGGWKIAQRRLVLDQNVLAAKNISVFF
ncbi:MAG TPA: 3-phenylpropionate/cinnamic acid dioxygenase subunit beta [Stellaceae bacterium]|nr:3-phenylpropionate/cinnamic acid dioxygenase subunit beta [Stellaceae bacterium]